MKRYVAYYRVSTNKQEYGTDAQRNTVRHFTGCMDGSCIEQEFIEVESGRNNKRKVLQEALNYCKLHKCTLVVAKLDRLSRNAGFLHTLKDAGVDFVCCDVPELNTLTLGVMASISQWEAERISQRTKEALQARKAKGLTKRTVNNLTPDRIEAGHKAISENAKTAKEVVQVLGYIQSMRKENQSYRKIASYLNERHFTTRTGKPFTAIQVQRIAKRFE